jgi:hypothetical protein
MLLHLIRNILGRCSFQLGQRAQRNHDTKKESTYLEVIKCFKFRFEFLTNKGGYGRYDNILSKFENEKGGIRDLSFDD